MDIIVLIFIGIIIISIIYANTDKGKKAIEEIEKQEKKQEEKQKQLKVNMDKKILCPHCQEKGHVTTQKIKKKKGISGAKATGAVLTAGLSTLATGLAKKEDVTEAKCTNCGQVWHY